jgi:hypothetical protein
VKTDGLRSLSPARTGTHTYRGIPSRAFSRHGVHLPSCGGGLCRCSTSAENARRTTPEVRPGGRQVRHGAVDAEQHDAERGGRQNGEPAARVNQTSARVVAVASYSPVVTPSEMLTGAPPGQV